MKIPQEAPGNERPQRNWRKWSGRKKWFWKMRAREWKNWILNQNSWEHSSVYMRSLISKRNIFKNMKMGVNTRSLFKIHCKICSRYPFFLKQFFTLQNEFEFCNLHQNTISPVKLMSERNSSILLLAGFRRKPGY